MENTELRIGNWVQYKDEYAQVSAIWANGNFEIHSEVLQFWTIEKGDEYVNGVPLTPDILVKCGFHGNSIGHNDVAFVLKSDWREQPSFHFYIEYTDSPFGNDKDMLYPIAHEIKYLHQLQNLYFALTNTELTIDTKLNGTIL